MARKKKIESDKPKKIVKKRKVGRPKKRGRKKKYYTPKKKSKRVAKKGFSRNVTYNRVRAILWSNFKDDFPSYRALISNQTDEEGNKIKGSSIVSQVFSQCKDLDCLDSDIIEIYNQFRNQLPDEENRPILPDYYFDTHYYWELETEDWWAGFDNRIWVVSPMLLTDPDFFLGVLGSDRYVDANGELINRRFDAGRGDYIIYGKSQRFKEFINYCNSLQTEGLISTSSEVPNWRFVGENDDEADVYWNNVTRRWEVRIVICDPFGTVEDYGFDPTEPDLDINEGLIQEIVQRTPTVEQTIETPIPPSIREEDVRIKEIEKTGKVERLEKKKEGILKEIETYSKLGKKGNKLIDNALERLNKINDELDKID